MSTSPGLSPHARLLAEGGQFLEGRYVLQEMIGRGGMATVYRATDSVLDRSVAVKLLHPTISREPEFVEQFLEMERRIARLFHPNLVTIFDAGLVDDTCYVVMEYVPGGSLRELVSGGRQIPVPEVVKIVGQVASALELLHSERIVHGDVKPDNVLLDEYGSAKLVDFGIARLATTTSRVIRSESVGGSAPYLAPEQLECGQYDARSDIYALGLVAYELLAGRKAFDGENWVAVAAARLARDPHPLQDVRPGLPPDLVALIMRCLVRDPKARLASAGELQQALDELPLGATDESAEPITEPLPISEADEAPPPVDPEPTVFVPAEQAPPAESAADAGPDEPTRALRAADPVRPRHHKVDRPTPRRPAVTAAGRQGASSIRQVLVGEHPVSRPLLAAALVMDLLLLMLIVLLGGF